jgi:hypothetical protein
MREDGEDYKEYPFPAGKNHIEIEKVYDWNDRIKDYPQ